MKFSRYLSIMAMIVVWSCTYDSEVVPENPLDCSEITYSGNVDPIIQSNCAISGCHVAGTGRANFRDFSTVQAFADQIKFRTEIRDMPRGGGTLTTEEINMIACWVDGGAVDN